MLRTLMLILLFVLFGCRSDGLGRVPVSFVELYDNAAPEGMIEIEIERDGTVREIEASVGDTAVSRLFSLLATLQFSRNPPDESDFEGACALALDVSVKAR